jgi:hypothetical protein
VVHVIQFFQHKPSTRFFLRIFTVVNEHNVVYGMITCDLGNSVSEEFTVCFFRRLSVDVGSLFLQNSIHSRLFCISVEGNNPSACWIGVR